jgi:hypothetical protein
MRVFYLHFNKNAERQGDPKVWSIRTSSGCYHTTRVVVEVPVETIHKDHGPSPRAFLKGKGCGWLVGETIVLMAGRLPSGTSGRLLWGVVGS